MLRGKAAKTMECVRDHTMNETFFIECPAKRRGSRPKQEQHETMCVMEHQWYWLTAIALLIPPIGLLISLPFLLHNDPLDRALGSILLNRAIILPLVCLLLGLLVLLVLQNQANAAWRWW
jgi:hypothetical protein